jgi:hypothetical protein
MPHIGTGPAGARAAAFVITLAAGLGGCGGGSNSVALPAQPGTAPTRTVAEHAALRPASHPMPGPNAAQRAAVLAATQDMTLTQLRGEMSINARSVIAAPALVFGHAALLRQGAAGTTRAELEQGFPTSGDAASDSLLTEPLSRQVWGAAGRRFLLSFLNATDGNGQPSLLTTWTGADADFSFGAAVPALPADAPELPTDRANLRLVVLDRLDLKLSWPAPTVEEGVFRSETDQRSKFSFVRLRDGVRSSPGANYRSDFLRQGSRTLVQIRPDATVTALGDWVRNPASGLERALREIASAIAAAPAGHAAGEILLPVGAASLPAPVDTVMWRRNVVLAYSATQANFSNIDGAGGAFAISNTWRGSGNDIRPATRLEFRADGTNVLVQHLTSFVYSPLNVNQQGGSGTQTFDPGFGACPHTGVDLRPYLLAQIDDTLGWLWVASFVFPPGSMACISGG